MAKIFECLTMVLKLTKTEFVCIWPETYDVLELYYHHNYIIFLILFTSKTPQKQIRKMMLIFHDFSTTVSI